MYDKSSTVVIDSSRCYLNHKRYNVNKVVKNIISYNIIILGFVINFFIDDITFSYLSWEY